MYSYFRKTIFTLTVFLILAVSAIKTVPAYADDGTPPVVETPAAVEPTQVPDQNSAEEEAALPSTPEVDPVSTEIPSVEQTPVPDVAVDQPAALPELPQGTDLVVVDEQGEPLPLATQEAAQAIASSDPIWCPATVTKPIAGQDGCTVSFGQFVTGDANTGLWDYLALNQPNVDGIIWITGYTNVDSTDIIFNGSNTFASMADYKLTINGGWDGDGTNTFSAPSTFDIGLSILNWKNDVTINNILVNGAGTDGIKVTTSGNITFKNVESSGNSGYGADLDNSSGTGNVTITTGKFNSNSSDGLKVYSKGLITLKDITANGNTNNGAYLNNHDVTVAKAVTLSGVNTFNSNTNGIGLKVESFGAITLSDLTATKNGNAGADIRNNYVNSIGAITLTGTNIFSENASGLLIFSNGAIKVNNVAAIQNAGVGIQLINNTAAQPVTLTGFTMSKYNGGDGIYIDAKGAVTAANVTASYNTVNGLNVADSLSFVLSGTNSFSFNQTGSGAYVLSRGAITIPSVTANGNGSYGMYLDNLAALTPSNITLTGSNTFNDNKYTGLQISASGIISTSNLTANNNGSNGSGGRGVQLGNALNLAAPKAIIVTGINSANGNWEDGFLISSYGTITVNNLTANSNGLVGMSSGSGHGLLVYNDSATTPAAITLAGTNVFNNNYESGLYISTKGQVTGNNITSSGSSTGYGVYINNTYGSTAGVKLTGINAFNDNKLTNLQIQTHGTVTISNVSANNSASGYGMDIQNNAVPYVAPVTISGVNSASGNWLTGVSVMSRGAISLNSLTASNNGLGNVGGTNFGVILDNSSASTAMPVTLSGTNVISDNKNTNLIIATKGNILINNLTAKDSELGNGASLWNTTVNTIVNVTMTGVNVLSGNKLDNLYIQTYGTVLLNNITANDSVSGVGASISNGTLSAPKAVTINGINSFNNNIADGLNVASYGVVTLSNITANGNGFSGVGSGVLIHNQSANVPAAVTLTGTNTINNNVSDGLRIQTKGAITISNLTASGNGVRGAQLSNNGTGNGITLTGVNSFIGNQYTGLEIISSGAILLNNVNSSSNTGNGNGAYIENTYNSAIKPVTLAGTNIFNNNSAVGLYIKTNGAVITNNITANGSVNNQGVWITNDYGLAISNVTMNGINTFSSNKKQGLLINSFGAVTLSNVTASGNGQAVNDNGVEVINNNSTSLMPVTLNGVNTFNGNYGHGLSILSKGAVVVNNITANNNIYAGAYINNTFSGTVTPKTVTILGVNNFNNNGQDGLVVSSNGAITTNNLTANNNISAGYYGAALDNSTASIAASITLNGVNTFNGNHTTGLGVYSIGIVKLNNITANGTISNTGSAVLVDNHNGAATASVTLAGANNFIGNNNSGLKIISNGIVNLTKITADDNNGSGLDISTTGNVNLTCGYFTDNTVYGWSITTPAIATLKGVISVGNGTNDEFFPGAGTLVKNIACPLP